MYCAYSGFAGEKGRAGKGVNVCEVSPDVIAPLVIL